MKTCKNCGNEVEDDVMVCDKCGAEVKGKPSGLSIAAFILAFLVSPVAVILSIIDLVKKNGKKKGLSIAALIIGILGTIVGLISAIVLLFLAGTLGSQAAKYTEKTNISYDTQLCDTVRTAILTSCLDPSVVTDPNAGIPEEGVWIDVADINTNTAFGKTFSELMGMKPAEIESHIKSKYNGKKASGMQFKISGNTVEVRIQNSENISVR